MWLALRAMIIEALAPVLATDAVLGTDCSGFLAAAARLPGVEHHALNLSRRERVRRAWCIQSANAYHARLKNWMRRFNGVASAYLVSYPIKRRKRPYAH